MEIRTGGDTGETLLEEAIQEVAHQEAAAHREEAPTGVTTPAEAPQSEVPQEGGPPISHLGTIEILRQRRKNNRQWRSSTLPHKRTRIRQTFRTINMATLISGNARG